MTVVGWLAQARLIASNRRTAVERLDLQAFLPSSVRNDNQSAQQVIASIHAQHAENVSLLKARIAHLTRLTTSKVATSLASVCECVQYVLHCHCTV
jgi:hypothetical protein